MTTTITKADKEHYKNNILTKFPTCKITMYIDRVERSKNMPYATVSSKKQFATILSNNKSKESIIFHSNLYSLISKFIVAKDYMQTIKHILRHNKDDQIYVEIAKYTKPSHDSSSKQPTTISDIPKHRCGRDIMQAEDIITHITDYIQVDKNYEYLDIGCGSCYKTKYIGELLDLPLENIYGADIPSWFTYTSENRVTSELGINFIELEANKPLPIESNKFDLVTALYMLHHVKDLALMLQELNRIIKMDGYLFLSEHDAPTPADKMLCDIEHGLYAIVYEKDTKYYDTYYATYYDWIEWDLLLLRFGFKYIKADYVFDVNNNMNPTRKFYAIYKKIENRSVNDS